MNDQQVPYNPQLIRISKISNLPLRRAVILLTFPIIALINIIYAIAGLLVFYVKQIFAVLVIGLIRITAMLIANETKLLVTALTCWYK